MRFRNGLRWLAVAASLVATSSLAAQSTATITGRVTDESGAALSGVQMVITNQVSGVQYGSLSQADGRYAVPGLRPGGPYRVEARMIGYGLQTVDDVRLETGQTVTLDFRLSQEAIAIDALEVFASRAIERKTPVAFSDVEKVQIEQQLGSRDIPTVLNTTPSVYSTEQGGGAGDARINVRGFDQRNVAVMINGVPVNDMENGWVYWSNWDGVGYATASIQLQRGLSAVNLATAAIGGSLNVITDPTAMRRGWTFKQEAGNDGFLKSTFAASTGMIHNKFAFMASGVRKTADGQIDGAWTDAWAYYIAATYQVNRRNRFDLYAIGAPQRHGQRLYKQNIGAFDADFARSLKTYDPKALEKYPQARDGLKYNQNVSPVSSSYKGKQAVGGHTFDRHDSNYINERENFYHKPQINLNWYSYLADGLTLSTVAYYSGGHGGGTGTKGKMKWDYSSNPTRVVDYDATIAANREAGVAKGVLRNSRNNQWTIGAVSKLKKQVSEPLTVEVGLDWRTAQIEHYREVRDLLGGPYYLETHNDFWTGDQQKRGLGDKMDYNFTNTVDWLGGFVQSEYATGKFTVYGMGGLSTIKYGYTNYFKKAGDGNPLHSETNNIVGWQVKGGGLVNLTDELGVFTNLGYVSKLPIFDAVIDDRAGIVNQNPKNESFFGFEAGLNYRSLDRALAASLNVYHTKWNNRTRTRGYTLEDGTDVLVSLLGLDQLHQGVEATFAYRPAEVIRFDVGASVGNWRYTDDASGTVRLDSRTGESQSYDYYVKDLKVGDAPQTQLMYGVTLFPTEGFYLELQGSTYDRHYAAFDPFSRTDPSDRTQSWQAPGYTTFNIHAGYDLPGSLRLPADVRMFVHVFNVFNSEYIQDATDNSRFNGFDKDHDADDAEVFMSLPRRFNLGFQIKY